MASESHSSDNDKQTSGVTIGDVEGDIRDSIIAGRDVSIGQRITNLFLGSTEQQRAQRNRRAMLELVKNFWVKGVLKQSLHGAAMIELGLEERADAVERPWDMVLQTPDRPNRPLPPGTKIIDVFDEMIRALLILGEPGSGKTTMLLELARDTIARAEEDLTQPIPVVFNLSSWAEKRQPIAEWLVEELNTKYNIPKKIARPWVENDELLLLLDGLDEVALERREDCVRAINDFRQEHMVSLVVCSRIADYEALTTPLKLQGAILLQPLTPHQIDEHLKGAGTELLVVRRILQHDPALQELAQSPLMLSIMILAYRETLVEDLHAPGSAKARRRHLLDAYVQQMFRHRDVDKFYPSAQTVRWLTWLAQRMIQYGQTVFLIERMQPYWLPTNAQRWLYAVIQLLTTGLLFGLLLGLFFAPLGGLRGLLVALLIGLFIAWGLGPPVYSVKKERTIYRSEEGIVALQSAVPPGGLIEPAEALKWSWKNAGKGLLLGLFFGLPLVLFVGLLGESLGDVLPFALSAGLVLAMLGVLLFGLGTAETKMTTLPNQGIRNSIRNAIIAGLLSWLLSGLTGLVVVSSVIVLQEEDLLAGAVGGLVGVLVAGLVAGLVVGLPVMLFFGLLFGGRAAVRHFILRFLLYRSGYMPWNYARFLDYAAERIFLRKVGGGYIFVHRLLLEHFAAKSIERTS